MPAAVPTLSRAGSRAVTKSSATTGSPSDVCTPGFAWVRGDDDKAALAPSVKRVHQSPPNGFDEVDALLTLRWDYLPLRQVAALVELGRLGIRVPGDPTPRLVPLAIRRLRMRLG